MWESFRNFIKDYAKAQDCYFYHMMNIYTDRNIRFSTCLNLDTLKKSIKLSISMKETIKVFQIIVSSAGIDTSMDGTQVKHNCFYMLRPIKALSKFWIQICGTQSHQSSLAGHACPPPCFRLPSNEIILGLDTQANCLLRNFIGLIHFIF